MESDANLTDGPNSGPPLPAGGSVVQALRDSLPQLPVVLLRDPEADTVPPDQACSASEKPINVKELGAPSRYQLHGEIARGGMGAVLRGHDVDLGREIAVKVLLETHKGRTELLQRFVEEAQIGGQLQHPGVVPVYELGVFPDNRPYFTMKLVKGSTLAALLAERQDSSRDRPRFLKIFEQVCQTVAYAHSRGVIHRDLKPLNVMVGAFGEVQVMDWGLAKVLAKDGTPAKDDVARPQSEPPSVIRTGRSEGSPTSRGTGVQTQAGSVLGTPAYMPPEQARGQVDRLDKRSDVFGLGAILYEILTGRPPYIGDATQVICQAMIGDLDPAFRRLGECAADVDLAGLTKRCLAARPEERPRDAGELASQLTAYFESVEARLRRAELERAAAEAKAQEERKRRRTTLALAAAVLALVVVGGGAGMWWWHERTAIIRDVEAALERVEASRVAGRWQEVRTALEYADGRLGVLAPEALRAKVCQARADVDFVQELEAMRFQRGTEFLRTGSSDVADWEGRFSQAFQRWGIDMAELEPWNAADQVRNSAIREQLLLALDEWISYTEGEKQQTLSAIANGAEYSEWRRALREAELRGDKEKLKELANQDETLKQPAIVLNWLESDLCSAGLIEEAASLLRKAQQRYPGDFWINYELGRFLTWDLRPRRPGEGVGYLRAALSLRPDNATVLTYLGCALQNKGDRDGAAAAFSRAIALEPTSAFARNNLGNLFLERKEFERAAAEFRQAMKIAPQYAAPHINMGLVLQEQGNRIDALAYFQDAVKLVPDDAASQATLGHALRNQAEPERALIHLRKAIELDAKEPWAHVALGEILEAKEDVDGAIDAYKKALALDPKETQARLSLCELLKKKGEMGSAIDEYRKAIAAIPIDSNLAGLHFNLGNALAEKKNVDEAIGEYRVAITLNPKLADAYIGLGGALLDKGEEAEAVAAYKRALDLDPKNASVSTYLRTWFIQEHRLKEAQAVWKMAIEQNPPDHESDWFGYAALCLYLEDDAEYRRIRHTLLEHFGGTTDRAIAQRTAKECLLLSLAGEELSRAAALAEQAFPSGRELDFFAHFQLAKGLAEYRQGHLDKAVEHLQAALFLGWLSSSWNLTVPARLTLAMVEQKRGQKAEARKKLAAAVVSLDWRESRANDHDAWICHVLRREAESLILPNLPAFLRREYQPQENDERLALLGICQLKGDYRAAARLYADAFAADPKLADDLKSGARYSAAYFAVLAGCGHDKSTPALRADERARWRKQALDWLRADLAAWTKLANDAEEHARIRQTLQGWLKDADLAGIRDDKELAKLPTDEREQCRKLWADVEALLEKVHVKK
jgi:serine/threonine-protein kinase